MPARGRTPKGWKERASYIVDTVTLGKDGSTAFDLVKTPAGMPFTPKTVGVRFTGGDPGFRPGDVVEVEVTVTVKSVTEPPPVELPEDGD